jgi:hypothetical protein
VRRAVANLRRQRRQRTVTVTHSRVTVEVFWKLRFILHPRSSKQLARILSASERTIRDWLSRIDKDNKEKRDRRIFELWLACWTIEEIAAEAGCHKDTVSEVCRNMANLPKSDKPAAEHATDFDPPIYNIWKQQTKTTGSSHFGNSEVRWLDNLLYLYTEPFDVVVAAHRPDCRFLHFRPEFCIFDKNGD